MTPNPENTNCARRKVGKVVVLLGGHKVQLRVFFDGTEKCRAAKAGNPAYSVVCFFRESALQNPAGSRASKSFEGVV
jgi:hypothetical protein